MSKKVEYLEKYSVAPSPNRDYYGIKVLTNEIILFLWKISHGPHRIPVIRVSKFSEFGSDKISQDEIQRIFGNYLLEHVRNISERKLSLLTLPKHIIAKITNYLKIKDILNLSTLSHISKEVFDNETVWELMYKMSKVSKIAEDKKLAMTSSWKQLLKEKQLKESVKNRMSCADEPKADQHKNLPKKIKKNQKSPHEGKFVSKLDLEKKETPVKRTLSTSAGNSMDKISNDIQNVSKGREVKQNRQFTINKNQQSISLKNVKTNLDMKSTESIESKNVPTNIVNKLKSSQTVNDRNKKLTSNSKNQKLKRIHIKEKLNSESKLGTFDTEEQMRSFKYNHNSAITSLIEENLKKMKSPRSIFNYDFSVLDDSEKSSGDSKHLSPKYKNKCRIDNTEEMEKEENSNTTEIPSDEEMDRLSQNYLKARADFMKSMNRISNLQLFGKQNFPNDSSFDQKNQKSSPKISKGIGKFRSSILKDEDDTEIIKELSKIHFPNDNI